MVVSQNDDSKYGIDSIIYSFDGNALEIYQSVPTDGAIDAKYFEINRQRYLAIAQYYGDRTSLEYGVNSQILKWRNKRFEHIQYLPTKGAFSVAHFNVENDTFIAFANHYDSSYSVNSHVYKWISGQFVLFQSIPSLGAISIKYIQIGNLHFIAIAHHYTDQHTTLILRSTFGQEHSLRYFSLFQRLVHTMLKHLRQINLPLFCLLIPTTTTPKATTSIPLSIFGMALNLRNFNLLLPKEQATFKRFQHVTKHTLQLLTITTAVPETFLLSFIT
ncbi:thrombospondin-type laminin G domain and EAR repeat-containing protein-like [Corticium candelabrum]|uniref:thrombospondin-type laminin G domain and EAR repeat-containing protein-like n=1 Tax=Corticium candelabrum TaxID=121492 RepID=UPI002E273551|nr:thrombospondin-type laminin G domain and EAR repeat-containing protein-like [Corticium candelabrum]